MRVLERLHENLALVSALAGRARVHTVGSRQHCAALEPVLLVADRHDQLHIRGNERVDKHAVAGAFVLSSVSEDQRDGIAKSSAGRGTCSGPGHVVRTHALHPCCLSVRHAPPRARDRSKHGAETLERNAQRPEQSQSIARTGPFDE